MNDTSSTRPDAMRAGLCRRDADQDFKPTSPPDPIEATWDAVPYHDPAWDCDGDRWEEGPAIPPDAVFGPFAYETGLGRGGRGR